MDECKLCLPQSNVKASYDIFIRGWATLGSIKFIVYSMHNIGGGGCNTSLEAYFTMCDI